ncbi:hypothetical protein HD553DRAFT_342110 [Filobasidium floriforme]|uniref:uncharacterized protein n=1 Tax=Filobasidium floriforme TaxID=5210 RepID=UPI001E8E779D|nr:uncharacterized protein HD553DRAFT_342110 [Filobasidium floriforme]KAH8084620.1 hypothetical protein HD553DRAFT_342110 [Filobasidium floriforme]
MPKSPRARTVPSKRSTRVTTRATATSAKTPSHSAAQSLAVSKFSTPQRALSFDSDLSSAPPSDLESDNIYNDDIAHPAKLETIQDKVGEAACESSGRLEDMENEMETEEVQKGASESAALQQVEADESMESDKADEDNSTQLVGPGADNSMELDKVEMVEPMELEPVGADNLVESEIMEADKAAAESDIVDHRDPRSSCTTDNERSSEPALTSEAKRQEIRMGKRREILPKTETEVQVRDSLTKPAGLGDPGRSTSELFAITHTMRQFLQDIQAATTPMTSEIEKIQLLSSLCRFGLGDLHGDAELGKQRRTWLSSNGVSLRNFDPEALLKMGLITEMEKDQIVSHKQAIKRFGDLKENVDRLSQLWTDTGSSQPLDVDTMSFLEGLVPEVGNLLELLAPGISSKIETGGNTRKEGVPEGEN